MTTDANGATGAGDAVEDEHAGGRVVAPHRTPRIAGATG